MNAFRLRLAGLEMEPLVLDGAMGTELLSRGLRLGACAELWNLTHPDEVGRIHKAYVDAGAEVVLANTFGANRSRYHEDVPLCDVIQAGVGLAREAALRGRFVALDVGRTGLNGTTSAAEIYDAFAEQIRLGAEANPDLVYIETMTTVRELQLALQAARENSNLPIFATVTVGSDGRLLGQDDLESVVAVFDQYGPDAVGLNCGPTAEALYPVVRRMAALVNAPLIVKASAGLPRVGKGDVSYDCPPERFARAMVDLVKLGVSIVGGCCGTTPAHIARLVAELKGPERPYLGS